MAEDNPRFPVLIFLEGATGFRQMNTFQVEALASHGYIVVALDQPGVAAAVVFPDGRQVAGMGLPQLHPGISCRSVAAPISQNGMDSANTSAKNFGGDPAVVGCRPRWFKSMAATSPDAADAIQAQHRPSRAA